MQFSRVIGNIDPKMVKKAEEAITKLFLDLAIHYNNKHTHTGSGLGGDAFLFTLLHPAQHICTMNMPTAATDGKRFYWNPKYVIKLHRIGLRLVSAHEAWHAIYMHPARRGSRNPMLWNIAVDYIVNYNNMEDLRIRGFDAAEYFHKYKGKYQTLSELIEQAKDPFAYSKKLRKLGEEEMDPVSSPASSEKKVDLPAPGEDRELTQEEKDALEKTEKKIKYYYADPNLPEDMRTPEAIYDCLYKLLPKCPKCGRLGVYPYPDKNKGKKGKKSGKKDKKDDKCAKCGLPKSDKKNKGQDQQDQDQNQPGQVQPGQNEQGQDKGDQPGQGQKNKPGKGKGNTCKCDNDDHEHGDDGSPCDCDDPNCQGQGNQPGQGQGEGDSDQGGGDQSGQGQNGCDCDNGKGCCGGCSGGVDIFGLGGTVDHHMDSEESKDKMAKKISDAMESARKMAGHVPAGLEDELGRLTAPVIKWTDIIRSKLMRTRQGDGRNDWTRFRTRQMFVGLLTPKKKTYTCNFGCLLDTSGSMSQDDMARGVSQLQALDERNEGWITFADSTVYFDKSVKIKKVNQEELSKIKPVGRGGTVWSEYFSDYEKHIGKCDFLIIISDLYLDDVDVANMVDPGIPVYWLCTSNNTSFKQPFGKILYLNA